MTTSVFIRSMAAAFVLATLSFTTVSGQSLTQCATNTACANVNACKLKGTNTIICCTKGELAQYDGVSCYCNASESGGWSYTNGSFSKIASCATGSVLLGQSTGSGSTSTDCTKDACSSATGSSCTVGSSQYCCPGGFITAVSSSGTIRSCSCTYGKSGYSCTRNGSPPFAPSGSGLTCALVLALLSSAAVWL